MDERSEVERRGAGAPEAGLPPRFVPAVPHTPTQPPSGGPGRSAHVRRRFTRTGRGAAGLGIAAAALLLWPFSGWAWLPWLAGLGALVVLRILRLDGLLRGWAWHLGGLVVVAGLMLSSDPWAWAFAASIGVLLAGLARLPRWRLAAVGAVLCVGTGVGFWVSQQRAAQEVAAQEAQTRIQTQAQLGAPRPNAMLPILLTAITRSDAAAVCRSLVAEPARGAFAAAVGQPDCAAAVRALASRVTDPRAYPDAEAPSSRTGTALVVDGCALEWRGSVEPGPQLARLTIDRTTGTGYFVVDVAPC